MHAGPLGLPVGPAFRAAQGKPPTCVCHPQSGSVWLPAGGVPIATYFVVCRESPVLIWGHCAAVHARGLPGNPRAPDPPGPLVFGGCTLRAPHHGPPLNQAIPTQDVRHCT
eukprot:gene4868-biopygen16100